MRKVTERIIELGDKKELVTQEDLPYIVSDVLKHGVMEERVSLKSYIVNLAYGLKPMATLKIEINGKEYEESSSGDGQYDAFVRALRKIYKVTLGRKFPMLTNYAVTIPPGGRTDAFVQTVITWSFEDAVFRTRGLDADQTEAAIKATVKMLNIIEDEYESKNESHGEDEIIFDRRPYVCYALYAGLLLLSTSFCVGGAASWMRTSILCQSSIPLY